MYIIHQVESRGEGRKLPRTEGEGSKMHLEVWHTLHRAPYSLSCCYFCGRPHLGKQATQCSMFYGWGCRLWRTDPPVHSQADTQRTQRLCSERRRHLWPEELAHMVCLQRQKQVAKGLSRECIKLKGTLWWSEVPNTGIAKCYTIMFQNGMSEFPVCFWISSWFFIGF